MWWCLKTLLKSVYLSFCESVSFLKSTCIYLSVGRQKINLIAPQNGKWGFSVWLVPALVKTFETETWFNKGICTLNVVAVSNVNVGRGDWFMRDDKSKYDHLHKEVSSSWCYYLRNPRGLEGVWNSDSARKTITGFGNDATVPVHYGRLMPCSSVKWRMCMTSRFYFTEEQNQMLELAVPWPILMILVWNTNLISQLAYKHCVKVYTHLAEVIYLGLLKG